MGYTLHAFICKDEDSYIFLNAYTKAKAISLDQGITLIPFTTEFYDEINDNASFERLGDFVYLTKNIEKKILEVIGDKSFAYIEADYFGGKGSQAGIIWSKNKRQKLIHSGNFKINEVLSWFGIVNKTEMDAFDTLDLGRNRSTDEWLIPEIPTSVQPVQVQKKVRRLVNAKSLFTISLIVIALTILAIWLFGLGQHRTIFSNSILSTTIISVTFFLFVTIGLYRGIKLKDDVGKLTDKLKPSTDGSGSDFSQAFSGSEYIALGDDIAGIVASIILWIIVTILLSVFLWLFGAILWSGIVAFLAMLYWIFFRALRLVFKNRNKCQGHIGMSITYGLGYTILYMFWIYAIILIAHYLI